MNLNLLLRHFLQPTERERRVLGEVSKTRKSQSPNVLRAADRKTWISPLKSVIFNRAQKPLAPCKNRAPGRATACASLTESQILCVHSCEPSLPLCNIVVIADELALHNVLWITKNESRVILSWSNNLTREETEKYTVEYILSYKFFNTTHEKEVSCSAFTRSLKWNHVLLHSVNEFA